MDTRLTLPDCAHCSAAGTLAVVYAEMGVEFCECSCCNKWTRVDYHGVAHKVEPRDPRNGLSDPMYSP